jgi:4-hydroxy-3-polyprenylbenzoate decarboxylase
LTTRIPSGLNFPDTVRNAELVMPGIIALSGNVDQTNQASDWVRALAQQIQPELCDGIAMFVVVDDAKFTAANLRNFLWATFTRSDPARDIYGVGEFSENKHWGCRGPLVIDARVKPHHAPGLFEDPAVTKKVDALAAKGGSLAKYL